MGFKRAEWHSGLTYKQTCETCKSVVQYTDYSLDFRPWYADGFVYCPKCKTPLRHRESYAIDKVDPTPIVAPPNPDAQPAEPAPQPAPQSAAAPQGAAFCPQCGNRFGEADRFCAQCGTKRG